MRFNTFAPFNILYMYAIINTPNQSLKMQAAMEASYQAYMAGLNYGNRNATSKYTSWDIIKGFSGAIFASTSISMLSKKLVLNRLPIMTGPKSFMIYTLFNFLTLAISNICNLLIIRNKEMKDGIEV